MRCARALLHTHAHTIILYYIIYSLSFVGFSPSPQPPLVFRPCIISCCSLRGGGNVVFIVEVGTTCLSKWPDDKNHRAIFAGGIYAKKIRLHNPSRCDDDREINAPRGSAAASWACGSCVTAVTSPNLIRSAAHVYYDYHYDCTQAFLDSRRWSSGEQWW